MTRRLMHLQLPILIFVVLATSAAPATAKTTLREWVDRSLRNIMAVHMHGAKQTDFWRMTDGPSPVSDQPDKKVTVKPIVPFRQLGRSLECHQLQTRSFRDWQQEKVVDANGQTIGPHISSWMLPAYRKITVASNFGYFADWPVFVSMAVFGNEFEMEHILNHHRDRISVEVLKKTHELHEYRYDLYTKNLLYRRPIKLIRRKQCDGFRIFDFEVHERG